MCTPEKVGDKTQGVPSTPESTEEMSPSPPTDLRPWMHLSNIQFENLKSDLVCHGKQAQFF